MVHSMMARFLCLRVMSSVSCNCACMTLANRKTHYPKEPIVTRTRSNNANKMFCRVNSKDLDSQTVKKKQSTQQKALDLQFLTLKFALCNIPTFQFLTPYLLIGNIYFPSGRDAKSEL